MAGQAAAELVRQAIEQTGSADVQDVCKVLPLLARVELAEYSRITQDMIDTLLEKKGITGTKVLGEIIQQVQGQRPVRTKLKHYNERGRLLRALGGDRDLMCW